MDHLSLLVFSLVAVASVQANLDPSKYPPRLRELSKTGPATCLPKTGVDAESVQKILKGEFIDEPKTKAYIRCIILESKAYSDEKGLDKDVAAELIPSDILEESTASVKFCLNQIKDITNKEDRAFNLLKCHYGRNPDIFIFF